MSIRKLCILLFLYFFIFSNSQAQEKVVDSTEIIEASKIIDYANTVISLSNAYSATYGNYDSMVRAAQKEIREILNNPGYIIPDTVFVRDTIAIDSVLYNDYNGKLQQAPEDFEGKENIANAVNSANESIRSLFESSRALNTYFLNKEYKKDSQNMSAFRTLSNNLLTSVDKADHSWKMASREATKAGNSAENTMMKNSKRGALIIPVKNDMLALRILTEDTLDEGSYVDRKELKQRSDSLLTVFNEIKNNGNKSVSKMKKPKQKLYTEFYNSGHLLLKYIESLLEIIDKKRPRNPGYEDEKDQFFEDVSKRYHETVNIYNNFTR